MNPLALAVAVLLAYLLGSLSFAVIVSRAFGLADPRSYGSKNPGATNVLRSGSKPAAIATLLLDAFKGALPVLLVRAFGTRLGLGADTQAAEATVALAAFAGHLWPVFFGFKGGKGVATAAGALLALNPLLGLATLASFALIVAFFRYVSLASIVAAAFAPFYQLLIWGMGPLVPAIVAMSLLLVWKHGPNIRKLLDGSENKLGQKSAAAAAPTRRPTR
ncbi:glycerol-3-phosphate 1-O-acyltransferase PlsY [Methylibium sp.]|uniref:glycerol-3-phosphate 1-O-acyltransferase PlsY n=1 Tax=Methylibium sp. TaxID=2067992 RepID=UPI0039C98656